MTAPSRGSHGCPKASLEHRADLRGGVAVEAAHQGDVDVAAAQVAPSHLEGGEGRAEPGVDDHVRPVQVEVVGDPGRDDVGHHPGEGVLRGRRHLGADPVAEPRRHVLATGDRAVAAPGREHVVEVAALGVRHRRPRRTHVPEEHAHPFAFAVPGGAEAGAELVGAGHHQQLAAVQDPLGGRGDPQLGRCVLEARAVAGRRAGAAVEPALDGAALGQAGEVRRPGDDRELVLGRVARVGGGRRGGEPGRVLVAQQHVRVRAAEAEP